MKFEKKKMKMIDAAQILDMIGKMTPLSMLAVTAMAVIRLIFCNCPYARKRAANRIIHDSRDTVFPRNPDGRCVTIREMNSKVSGYRGIQRGLLKDTH